MHHPNDRLGRSNHSRIGSAKGERRLASVHAAAHRRHARLLFTARQPSCELRMRDLRFAPEGGTRIAAPRYRIRSARIQPTMPRATIAYATWSRLVGSGRGFTAQGIGNGFRRLNTAGAPLSAGRMPECIVRRTPMAVGASLAPCRRKPVSARPPSPSMPSRRDREHDTEGAAF